MKAILVIIDDEGKEVHREEKDIPAKTDIVGVQAFVNVNKPNFNPEFGVIADLACYQTPKWKNTPVEPVSMED